MKMPICALFCLTIAFQSYAMQPGAHQEKIQNPEGPEKISSELSSGSRDDSKDKLRVHVMDIMNLKNSLEKWQRIEQKMLNASFIRRNSAGWLEAWYHLQKGKSHVRSDLYDKASAAFELLNERNAADFQVPSPKNAQSSTPDSVSH